MLGVDARSIQKAWSFAVVGLTLWGFVVVRKTILTFVLAVMFSYLVVPVVRMLQRRVTRGARLPALLILFLGVPVSVASAGAFLKQPLVDEIATLQQQVRSPEFRSSLAQWSVLGIPLGAKVADGRGLSRIQEQAVRWLPEMRGALTRLGRDFTNVFLVPILAFFMLKDGKAVCDSILGFCMGDCREAREIQQRRSIVGILDDAHVLIQEYMQALLLLCLSVLVLFSAVLTLMHVRYALLLSLVASLLEFIPLVGPFVAGVAIVGVCEFNHFGHLSWMLGFLLLYRIVQDYVLSPYLMRRSVQLHPLLILFGVFAGGELGGIGGIFLSVPLLAVARLIFYEYRKQPRRQTEPAYAAARL